MTIQYFKKIEKAQ